MTNKDKEEIKELIEKFKEKIFNSVEFYASSETYDTLMKLQEKIKKI